MERRLPASKAQIQGAEASSLPQLKIWKEGNPPSADKTGLDGKVES